MIKDITNITKTLLTEYITQQYSNSGFSKDYNYILNKRLKSNNWTRPYFLYLVYKNSFGENQKDVFPALVAIEAFNISTYQTNAVLDNKITDDYNINNQIIVSNISLKIAKDQIERLSENGFHQSTLLESISSLINCNENIYKGQYIDLNTLNLKNSSIIDFLEFNDYKDLYLNRCELLGNSYELAFLLGNILGNSNDSLEYYIKAGRALGTMMQIVNDIGDLNDNNENMLKDFEEGKVTLPYYLISKDLNLKMEELFSLSKPELSVITKEKLSGSSKISFEIKNILFILWEIYKNNLKSTKANLFINEILEYSYMLIFKSKYSPKKISNKNVSI